jgi:hypothetical protein
MHYFIRNGQGGFQRFDEASVAAVREMPQGIRPEVLTDDHPEVVAWLMADARRDAVARTSAFANRMRERIAASRHYLQAARWSVQLASALAVKAGKASETDTSVLAREARLRARGETVEQLADKVLANSLVFASVGAAVDGIECATLDKISAQQGTDPAAFDVILAQAKQDALTEFLDIFTPVVGAVVAQARAAEFFGA